MLELVTYIVVALVLGAAILLAVASRRPDTFAFERTARVQATPERIYPLIADLRAMNTWNPFVEPDPAIRLAYSGPASGAGATSTWVGNRHVGEGTIAVVEAQAPTRVALKLEMVKPMKASNDVVFTLTPREQGTDVTWRMTGRQPLLPKVVTLFIDCEKMVGGQFDKGLAKLKSLAESTA